jgi:predicted ATP-grasp superfamily ATP-dependent carboligase
MPRLAFIRSVEFEQAAPYFAELADRFAAEAITAKVFYTDGVCRPGDFPGDSERLEPEVDPDTIVARLVEWGADAVVSVSIADQNALRDAVVKERLAVRGIPMAMHGLGTALQLADKRATKRLLADFGLSTPRAVAVDGDLLNGRGIAVPAYRHVIARQVDAVGYPLISKPLWNHGGIGMRLVGDEAGLHDYLDAPYDGNVLLERLVTGELCSVEIVGSGDRYVVQPVLWMGPTGEGPVFTFGRLRYAVPRPRAEADFVPVAAGLVELCRKLRIHGAVGVDMVYADGVYQILEINPRVSGATTMAVAASGLNTYDCLASIALGRWPARLPEPAGSLRNVTLQFPVHQLTPELSEHAERALPVVQATTYHLGDLDLPNILLACPPHEAAGLLPAIEALQARHGCLTEEVLRQIRTVLRPLEAGHEAVAVGRAGEPEQAGLPVV